MRDESDPSSKVRMESLDAFISMMSMQSALFRDATNSVLSERLLITLLSRCYLAGWREGRDALIDEVKTKVGK